MRHRQGTVKIYLPVIAAIMLLSLPPTLNLSIRDRISEFSSSLWRLVHRGNKEAPAPDKTEEIEAYLLHKKQAKEKAALHMQALSLQGVSVATILFRSAHSWNSSLWIDIGQEDNPKEGPPIIGKNSPVLSGDAVVGVVDYVGKKASLVRLITDSALTPAVRVARVEREETNPIAHSIQKLTKHAEQTAGLFQKEEEKRAFLYLLDELSKKYPLTHSETLYLAKGELQGHAEPLWRAPGKLLHGFGFQYDCQDSHGPARDLRTGAAIDPDGAHPTQLPPLPIIQEGDLLVTSGLDGVFPAGLKVARVHSISPLREGAFAYELLATPSAGDLLDLRYLFVLPPQKFSQEEIPTATDLIIKTVDEG